nr:hypothetical protein [Amycolatopsis anabasis]
MQFERAVIARPWIVSGLPQHSHGRRAVAGRHAEPLTHLASQLASIRFANEVSVVDDADAGGQPGHLGEDMAGEEDRRAVLVGETAEQVPDLHDTDWVQAVRGLVQDQQFRPVQQRLGEPEALRVAE